MTDAPSVFVAIPYRQYEALCDSVLKAVIALKLSLDTIDYTNLRPDDTEKYGLIKGYLEEIEKHSKWIPKINPMPVSFEWNYIQEDTK